MREEAIPRRKVSAVLNPAIRKAERWYRLSTGRHVEETAARAVKDALNDVRRALLGGSLRQYNHQARFDFVD